MRKFRIGKLFADERLAGGVDVLAGNLGKAYYDFFYESWAEGAPLLVTPEEARNAIRCVELITESARLNKTVEAVNMLPGREDFII